MPSSTTLPAFPVATSHQLERGRRFRRQSYTLQVLFFIGLHIPLVILFRASSLFATIHALLSFLVGLFWIIQDDQPYRPIYVLAYITGAELLWRGLHAQVFWEYGKYSAILLLFFMLLKYKGVRKADKRGLVFFAFLLPSIALMPQFDREAIAFALAGPLTLALAVTFFSKVQVSKENVENILVAFIAPILGLAYLVLSGILSAEDIIYYESSLKATSAGIGPNQVSSALGLGALAAFFYLIMLRDNNFLRLFTLGLVIWLLSQTAVTFSRGGLWTTVGALFVAGFYLQREKRHRKYFWGVAAFLFLIGYFVLFPALNKFTGYAMERRLSDFDLTRRDEMIRAELIAFDEHPILGVGPGQSQTYFKRIYGYKSNSHTEYTRIVAEHGMFGMFSLLMLLLITLYRFFQKASPRQKMYSLAFTAWALLYMFHSATRTVSPALLFGLGSLEFLDSGD